MFPEIPTLTKIPTYLIKIQAYKTWVCLFRNLYCHLYETIREFIFALVYTFQLTERTFLLNIGGDGPESHYEETLGAQLLICGREISFPR